MAELFTTKYAILWIAVLAAALFLPVRRLIWVMSVRKAERDGQVDEGRRKALRKRAGVTAALLALVFAYFYVTIMFKDGP
jgi:hypothetical protein